MADKTYGVNWDTDGEKVDLPLTVTVPAHIEDDEAADYISDIYGWCINSLVDIA